MSIALFASDRSRQRAASRSLLDFTVEELTGFVVTLGQPRYRARQLFHWLHARAADRWEIMSDLPADLRTRLANEATLSSVEVVRQLVSADGRTSKLLLRLSDGELIESVIMDTSASEAGRPRRTVCVSTQAGCAMGCVFCATGQMGFARHLSAGEIVAQVYLANRAGQRRVTNVVFMGMGEPLANYDQSVKALRLLADERGLHLSARAVTVSTVGLVPQIRRLASEGLAVNLAISLHAPNDDLRGHLMPVNHRWPIADVVAAGDEYAARTGRRVTYEYALIDGVNDDLGCARQLGRLLAGRLCHVNVIPLNPTPDHALRGTEPSAVRAFQRQVLEAGVPCTVRRNRGRDIEAACGQLRLRASRERRSAASRVAATEQEA